MCSRRLNGTKNTGASIVYSFLYVTAAELPNWPRVAAPGVYSDTPITYSEHRPLPCKTLAVRSLKKRASIFFFVWFPFSFSFSDCRLLERRVVRGSLRIYTSAVVSDRGDLQHRRGLQVDRRRGKRRLKKAE